MSVTKGHSFLVSISVASLISPLSLLHPTHKRRWTAFSFPGLFCRSLLPPPLPVSALIFPL